MVYLDNKKRAKFGLSPVCVVVLTNSELPILSFIAWDVFAIQDIYRKAFFPSSNHPLSNFRLFMTAESTSKTVVAKEWQGGLGKNMNYGPYITSHRSKRNENGSTSCRLAGLPDVVLVHVAAPRPWPGRVGVRKPAILKAREERGCMCDTLICDTVLLALSRRLLLFLSCWKLLILLRESVMIEPESLGGQRRPQTCIVG